MLKFGDKAVIVGGELCVGSEVLLVEAAEPGQAFEYHGYKIINTSKHVLWWVITNDDFELLVIRPHLMPLRGDENFTTQGCETGVCSVY